MRAVIGGECSQQASMEVFDDQSADWNGRERIITIGA